ncbi:ROK family transcriptional regulator [Nocardiopsis rhodophaea]|uniref:ROK family transcriptional regulator n=1 Tax=Nocardiopsis rhodophaea TaxID=280238 RepID=UPI0031D242AB
MTETEAAPGSQAELRRANQRRVVEALRAGGTLTQAEIARATGLSPASVSNMVRDLRAAGTVSVRETSSNGRRARAITLLRPPGAAVAIDFTPAGLTVALGDSQGTTLARESVAYDVAADPVRGVRRAVWLVETVLAGARVDHSTVTSVVASIPGPIDLATGEIGDISCLPRWAGFCPADALTEKLGVRAVAENDANLCALAETASGAGRGLDHIIHVQLSEGVGAGIVINGQLLRGARGNAGEIGHIGLDERGQVCRCGNRGCLETLAGAPYLLGMLPGQQGQGNGGGPATIPQVVAAADVGDPGCRRVIAEAGSALGRGIAILVNTFNPDLVTVGGELAAAGELLLEPMRREVQLGALGSAVRDLRIVRADFSTDSALRGALRLAAASAE